ncbi:MAG: YggS family pyridoxal phosphate-dependent enzyme [Candidatus Latescibacteria bacterium]|nr:YggS family pyridoxal phosphate-dependent enzyme [Candidatus Latescibacterota bacterium]
METVQERWEKLQERLGRAAAATDRDLDDIAVVAVTKTRSPEEIDAALKTGLHLVGENRIQEVATKKDAVQRTAKWHFIGHLQSNKAARAVELFEMVQSVDSQRLARALDRHAGARQRRLDILIQVNTSNEPSKSGVAPSQLRPLVEQIAPLAHLRICGLMTIGALSPDPLRVRACFTTLSKLRDQLDTASIEGVELRYLSMGMSGDFELAIAEGANMVRLGTILFGPRPT